MVWDLAAAACSCLLPVAPCRWRRGFKPPPRELFARFPEVSSQSVEELRQHKAFVKLLKKQYRELKELRRKHMKKICSLNKRQNAQLSQGERSRMRSQNG